MICTLAVPNFHSLFAMAVRSHSGFSGSDSFFGTDDLSLLLTCL